MSNVKECIFCKIVAGDDDKTTILHRDERYVVFRDIRPATPHHYLVVTRDHIHDPKQLNGDHIELAEGMLQTGHDILEKQNAADADARFGFHWPPFNTVGHLHMHAIGATSEIGWIGRGIFKPNSFWFVTVGVETEHPSLYMTVTGEMGFMGFVISVDWLLERLKKMKQKSQI